MGRPSIQILLLLTFILSILHRKGPEIKILLVRWIIKKKWKDEGDERRKNKCLERKREADREREEDLCCEFCHLYPSFKPTYSQSQFDLQLPFLCLCSAVLWEGTKNNSMYHGILPLSRLWILIGYLGIASSTRSIDLVLVTFIDYVYTGRKRKNSNHDGTPWRPRISKLTFWEIPSFYITKECWRIIKLENTQLIKIKIKTNVSIILVLISSHSRIDAKDKEAENPNIDP